VAHWARSGVRRRPFLLKRSYLVRKEDGRLKISTNGITRSHLGPSRGSGKKGGGVSGVTIRVSATLFNFRIGPRECKKVRQTTGIFSVREGVKDHVKKEPLEKGEGYIFKSFV